MMTIARSTAQLATQSNRQSPTVHDVLDTFDYLGMEISPLASYVHQAAHRQMSRKPIQAAKARHGSEKWADPTAEFLPSDDEDQGQVSESSVWDRLMSDIVPDHLPSQPPRHCWMFTPVYATQMLSELPVLQLVNRKLDNARLVETSLRRLIRETDKAALPELEPKVREEIVEMALDPINTHSNPTDGGTVENKEMEQSEKSSQPDVPGASGPDEMKTEPLTGPNEDVPVGHKDEATPSSDAPTQQPASNLAESTTDEAKEPTPSGNPTKLLDTKKPLLRAVNYKLSWYASLASNDSRLPSANLYTARLRGAVDEGGIAKRPRRYLV